MKISITTRTDHAQSNGSKNDHPSDEMLRFMFECALGLKRKIDPRLASRIELVRITFHQPIHSSAFLPTFYVIWHTPAGEKREVEVEPLVSVSSSGVSFPGNSTVQMTDPERCIQGLVDKFLGIVRSTAEFAIEKAKELQTIAEEVGVAAQRH